MQFCNFAKKMQNLNAFSLKNSVALDFAFFLGGAIFGKKIIGKNYRRK